MPSSVSLRKRCAGFWAFTIVLAVVAVWPGSHSSALAQPPSAATLSAISTLTRAASLPDAVGRPAEEKVLEAALAVQQERASLNKQAPFFTKLTGTSRDGGQRWRLVYLANRNAVVAARKGGSPPSFLDRGWYVDWLVTAVQRFEEGAKRVNQNGVFEFLGLGGFFFGYVARFKWPSPQTRTTMAFQPKTNEIHVFGQAWSSPFKGVNAGSDGDEMFESARVQDLNIFNFFYVDDNVAIAQGASGGIALWAATDAAWDAEHLLESAAILDS